jgi:hypothetical protein
MQFIPSRNTWGDIGELFGSGLSEGYTQRSDQMAIQKAVEGLPPNASQRDILNAVMGVNTYSPEAKQTAIKNYMTSYQLGEEERKSKKAEELKELEIQGKKQQTVDKATAERKEAHALIDVIPDDTLSPQMKQNLKNNLSPASARQLLTTLCKKEKSTDSQKKELERKEVESLIDLIPDEKITAEQKQNLKANASPASARQIVTQLGKPVASEFDKVVSRKKAEDYVDLTSNVIPKLKTTMEELKEVQDLAKGQSWMSPITGYVSKRGKTMENLSFLTLDPIIKIFNPAGALAQRKLELVKDMYLVKKTDMPFQAQAKIDAEMKFANLAYKRALEKQNLYEKYKGEIPPDIEKQFDKESESIVDVMLDYDINKTEEKKSLPDPAKHQDRVITNKKTGQKMKSNGKEWVPL